ncbi:MAG: flagellar biosynthetic protein FliR [Polyangia bacterium]
MTAGAATVLAAARMGPLALVAAPFGRAWAARAILAVLLVAAVVPSLLAQPAATMSALPSEIAVGLVLGLIAALPFAAAEAAGALTDPGVHPWRARRGERGPLAEAYLLFALALFAAADGPRLVAVAAGKSYVAWPIGRAPSAVEILGVGAQLVATAVTLAAPALGAMIVAELALVLIARVQPALGRAVDAAPLRALAVLLVAAAAVYGAAHAMAPTMTAAAHLQVAP